MCVGNTTEPTVCEQASIRITSKFLPILNPIQKTVTDIPPKSLAQFDEQLEHNLRQNMEFHKNSTTKYSCCNQEGITGMYTIASVIQCKGSSYLLEVFSHIRGFFTPITFNNMSFNCGSIN